MNRERGSTTTAAAATTTTIWRFSSRVNGGRVSSSGVPGFGLASHTHITATVHARATTAPVRDGSRGFREGGGRGRAMQQRSLSNAVLGSRPRSAYTAEVGHGDVVTPQVSQMRLELLHLRCGLVARQDTISNQG